MATYVVSDIHGHLRAFDRALELAQPGAHDVVYVLGDMIDRGPEPAGVIELVRSLPNARVLLGNHESMMIEALMDDVDYNSMAWMANGGYVTSASLDELPREAYLDVLDWVGGLPLFDVVEVENLLPSAAPGATRVFLLCHAGIDALSMRGYLATAGAAGTDGFGAVGLETWRAAMAAQEPEDLLWIRGAFWGEPTGLVDVHGAGSVVIAGHTPSILLPRYARLMSGDGMDADGHGIMAEVGATADTGGVADRVDIDCSAAAGNPAGQVGIMRLEDRRVWYARIEPDE